jgi:hypothetical protein
LASSALAAVARLLQRDDAGKKKRKQSWAARVMDMPSASFRAQHDVCSALSQPQALMLSVASAKDVDMVFSMVNAAYKVEDGDSGVAFKKTDRFLSHDEG